MVYKKARPIRRTQEEHRAYNWAYGERIKNLGGYWHDEYSVRLTTHPARRLALDGFLGSGGVCLVRRPEVEALRDILTEVLEVWDAA